MRRVALTKDGLFISRPGHDALNDRYVRLIDPRYRMLEQHAQGTATSRFVRSGDGWSLHRADYPFPALPYRPIVHYALAFNSGGEVLNRVRYPNYIYSHTAFNTLTPQGHAFVAHDHMWVETLINSVARANNIFRVMVTVMKADSGLQ